MLPSMSSKVPTLNWVVLGNQDVMLIAHVGTNQPHVAAPLPDKVVAVSPA